MLKKPKHWPYASPEQQKEGLAAISKYITMDDLAHACNTLLEAGKMKRARKKTLLKRLRRIKGIFYEEWKRESKSSILNEKSIIMRKRGFRGRIM